MIWLRKSYSLGWMGIGFCLSLRIDLSRSKESLAMAANNLYLILNGSFTRIGEVLISLSLTYFCGSSLGVVSSLLVSQPQQYW